MRALQERAEKLMQALLHWGVTSGGFEDEFWRNSHATCEEASLSLSIRNRTLSMITKRADEHRLAQDTIGLRSILFEEVWLLCRVGALCMQIYP